MRRLFASSLLLLLTACVSGNKVRADSEVIEADIQRARRSGAMRCAPVELATAEAHLDFARGELSQGTSYRASEHIRTAEAAIKQALALSKECAPKQVVVKDKPETPTTPTQSQVEVVSHRPQQVVVKIEERDSDGDGIPDKDDLCPDQPEDFDGFQDEDGCPDQDNDNDGVLDVHDKCPMIPGPAANHGCPQEGPKDSDGDGIIDSLDRCPDVPGPIDRFGCPFNDRDGDGIEDSVDKCPDEPEDLDGFQDEDGCPDLDNDNDGIPDTLDRCPTEAGPLENGGCPDQDRDGDGIIDRLDPCPDQPGPKETFGCPDPDRDGDGIPDRVDVCPDEAGSKETRGCPDPDRDGDGIPDRVDVCPDEHGIKEERGCPKKYKLVVVKRDKIEIKKQIKFGSGSAKILGKESYAILDDVAEALRDAPHIKKIRVEGHTDSMGNDMSNMRLSQKRADTVMLELLKRGIDPGRMEAVGFGETSPIAPNTTAKGRAENRRTEFNIVVQ